MRDGGWLRLRGYEAGLDLPFLVNPPTAIFCGNNLMAIGIMEAAQEKELYVPQDHSVKAATIRSWPAIPTHYFRR